MLLNFLYIFCNLSFIETDTGSLLQLFSRGVFSLVFRPVYLFFSKVVGVLTGFRSCSTLDDYVLFDSSNSGSTDPDETEGVGVEIEFLRTFY